MGKNVKKFYLCDMGKHKEKIEDPLKLLLPGVIYDYFYGRSYIGIKTKEDNLSIVFSAVRRGLEPLTPCVTGTYSNQLN